MDYRHRRLASALVALTTLAAMTAQADEAFYVAVGEAPTGSAASHQRHVKAESSAAAAPGLRRRRPDDATPPKTTRAAPIPATRAAVLPPKSEPASLEPGVIPAVEAAAPDTTATPAVAPEPQVDAAPEESLVRRRRHQGDAVATAVGAPDVSAESAPKKMDTRVSLAAVSPEGFRSDPVYTGHYDAEAQLAIYGGKRAVSTPRPLLELGYPQYDAGPLGGTHNFLGDLNLARPQFLAYGDFRLAYGNNDNGAIHKSVLAARLNLDLDLKLTGTERFHVLLRPLDQDGRFTRAEFKGAPTADGSDTQEELNAKPVTAFFEGDLGAIAQGLTGRYNGVDLPVALGLVPLLVQNGIWLDDAFAGAAITLPARNSRLLDISNFDITAFAGLDDVSTGALGQQNGKLALHAGRVFGLATFFERRTYYYEFDYGYLDDRKKIGGFDHSYHNVSAAVTTRIRDWLSYSVRVIHNLGQKDAPGFTKTADGTMLLWESSFMTSKPYTLLPYFNLFYADGTPQALARDAGGGGVLKNTGLNFETDGLTGFPKLDDNGFNAHGGALGLQYLFNLDRQIVVEAAALDRHGSASALGSEYAFGIRYQQPISRQWIFRTDGIVGDRSQGKDFYGVRAELRCKF